MSGTVVLAVLLVGAAVYLAVRPAVGTDRLAVLAERRAASRRSSAVQPDLARSADPPRSRLPVLSCALCGAVAVILIGESSALCSVPPLLASGRGCFGGWNREAIALTVRCWKFRAHGG